MKQRSLARNRLRRLSWLRFVLQLATVAGVYLGVSVAGGVGDGSWVAATTVGVGWERGGAVMSVAS